MLLTLRYALQTQTGLRPNNEDAAVAGPHLLAVADGVGGHAAGEIAAALAIEHLEPLKEGHRSSHLLSDLRDAVLQANSSIADRAATDPTVGGMATTLTAMLFEGQRVGLAHIGDSRAYLMRNGKLTQITKDDTMVQSLVDEGRITPEEAFRHPQRSLVLKVLNGEPVDPVFEVREVDPGDRYLICSDGLSDYVPSEEIAEVLRVSDPQRCPQQLIRLALNRGSHDNITCIVADVVAGHSGYNIAITLGAPGKSATVVSV